MSGTRLDERQLAGRANAPGCRVERNGGMHERIRAPHERTRRGTQGQRWKVRRRPPAGSIRAWTGVPEPASWPQPQAMVERRCPRKSSSRSGSTSTRWPAGSAPMAARTAPATSAAACSRARSARLRLLRLFAPLGDQDHLVRPRPLDRDLPRADAGRGRRRARDRHARLQPREPGRDDAGAGGGDLRQVHRGDREAVREEAARLRGALVGVRHQDQRAAAQEGHQVRPQPDEQRLPPVLRPGRRQVDQDRLQPAPQRLDDAARSAARRPTWSRSRPPGISTTCRR